MVNIETGLAINTSVAVDRTTPSAFRRVLGNFLRQSAPGVPVPGVIVGGGAGLLGVSGQSASALSYTINPGYAVVVRGAAPTLGGYIVGTASGVPFSHAAADASNPRIDVVYICQPDPEQGDATHARIDVLQGVPAASPVARTDLPQGSLALWNVTIPAGATAATALTFTSVRVFTSINRGIASVNTPTDLPASAAYGDLINVAQAPGYAGTVYSNLVYRYSSANTWQPWESEWSDIAGVTASGITGGETAINQSPGYIVRGRTRFIGGLVRYEGRLLLQGSTVAVTAPIRIRLPWLADVAGTGAGGPIQAWLNGTMGMMDGSTAAQYMGLASMVGNNYFQVNYPGTNGQSIVTSGTAPFTWAVGDNVWWAFEYVPA